MDKKRFLLILLALGPLVFAAGPAAAAGQRDYARSTMLSLWTGYSERLPVYNAAVADYTMEQGGAISCALLAGR